MYKIGKNAGKKWMAAVTAAFVTVAAATGCGKTDKAGAEERKETNSITVAASSDTGSMDPAGSIALTLSDIFGIGAGRIVDI
mgnify:CR=1 FL=1